METSDNPGVFRGFVDLAASIDTIMQEHLEHTTLLLRVPLKPFRTSY